MSDKRFAVGALMAAALLALAPAGCGGSDGDGDGSSSSGGDERDAVRQADTALRDAFESGDAKGYCSGLTPASARNEGAVLGGGLSCEAMVRTVARTNRVPRHNERPKIVSIEVNGDSATVKLSSPGSEKPFDAEYVKRDGRWLGAWKALAAGSLPTDESPSSSKQ